MTNFTGTLDVPSNAQAGFWPGLYARAIDAVARSVRRREARRALGALSDATLKDIGLSRGDIDSVAEAIANGETDPTRIRHRFSR